MSFDKFIQIKYVQQYRAVALLVLSNKAIFYFAIAHLLGSLTNTIKKYGIVEVYNLDAI